MALAAGSHFDLGSALIALGVFTGMYLFLYARRWRVAWARPAVQWGWLAAIICCALVAYLLGQT